MLDKEIDTNSLGYKAWGVFKGIVVAIVYFSIFSTVVYYVS